MREWIYRPTTKLPPLDYAPDVREVNGALLISASRKGESSPFFRSVDPLADDFTRVSPGDFPFWDPSLFQDDDGRLYLYWGCDDREPIRGVELDAGLHPIGEPADLLGADVESRGWERAGENYRRSEPKTEAERLLPAFRAGPFIEGAWMTRVNDRYYLQYAGPGTQWNSYADGYATSDSPLGPFTYDRHSPFSSVPGGFITGAGHGSTFQDRHGNWWHAATMRISVNHPFERRIGIFPAGFDDDGVLFCNQNFADYPARWPDGPFDPWARQEPEWMLLSYRTTVTCSSYASGHPATDAVNEDVRTWWAASGPGAGEWLQLDLGAARDVSAIQVNLADHQLAGQAPPVTEGQQFGLTWRGLYADHDPAGYRLQGSADGDTWTTLHDGSGDRPHGFFVLDGPAPIRYVRVTALRMPFGGTFAVSGLRVFGRGNGTPPAAVMPRAVRAEPRTARLTWPAAPTAQGYNVRYGSTPGKLYRSWLVYDRTELEVPTLNAGEDTWFAVDTFNENGVTPGEPVRATEPT
ncbi:hypothetical protein J3R03_002829 [Actinoplanes couchii]|nr:hypothetical protein [Actinoplanes couchii]